MKSYLCFKFRDRQIVELEWGIFVFNSSRLGGLEFYIYRVSNFRAIDICLNKYNHLTTQLFDHLTMSKINDGHFFGFMAVYTSTTIIT